MSQVDKSLVEILKSLAALEAEHEGLRDYARLNLREDTLAQVHAAIEVYDRRVLLLRAAQAALEALAADGHPELPVRTVAQAVHDDLDANAATIQAALAKFAPIVTAELNLEAGEAEEK